jgi:hypothetical protein
VWNPFRTAREERQRDREALLEGLDKILQAQRVQAEVSIEQSRALRAFIDSYFIAIGSPSRRVSTDESEYEAEQISWGVHGES